MQCYIEWERRERKRKVEEKKKLNKKEKYRENYLPRQAAGYDAGPQVWMRSRGSVWISSKLNFNYWVLNGDRGLPI